MVRDDESDCRGLQASVEKKRENGIKSTLIFYPRALKTVCNISRLPTYMYMAGTCCT